MASRETSMALLVCTTSLVFQRACRVSRDYSRLLVECHKWCSTHSVVNTSGSSRCCIIGMQLNLDSGMQHPHNIGVATLETHISISCRRKQSIHHSPFLDLCVNSHRHKCACSTFPSFCLVIPSLFSAAHNEPVLSLYEKNNQSIN